MVITISYITGNSKMKCKVETTVSTLPPTMHTCKSTSRMARDLVFDIIQLAKPSARHEWGRYGKTLVDFLTELKSSVFPS